jgi:hypothetical protein
MHTLYKSAPPHRHLKLLLLFLIATCTLSTAQPPTTPPDHPIQQSPFPAGWSLFPTPAENSDALLCANVSRQEWQVSLSDTGTVQIAQRPQRPRGIPPLELPPGTIKQPGMAGYESLLKTQNGWLLGFDQGEWGGSLWFVDTTGKIAQLSQENIHGFVETPRGVMVFVGLAHMTLDSGAVQIVRYPITTGSTLQLLAPLDGAPETFTKLSPDEALVATTHGISRIASSGAHVTLTHSKFAYLYPTSIVSTPDGTIYAGMRLFVVRLLPTSKPGEYTEQWLVPDACRQFHREGITCACSK